MQTLNFTCGRCSQLIAVSTEFLGQQVRCPYCQQVVQAPDSPPEPPPDDAPAIVAPTEEEESIFTDRRAVPDDIFGEPAPLPAIVLPPDPGPTVPATLGDAVRTDGSSEVALAPIPEPLAFGVSATAPAAEPPLPAPEFAPAYAPAPPSDAPASPPADPGAGFFPASASTDPVTPPRTRRGAGFLANPFLAFLVPYSVFITVVALYLYFKQSQNPHPLEVLPDTQGADHPGAAHEGVKGSVRERVPPDTPLPDQLRVTLGQTLRLGDLAVTPTGVELRRVQFCSERPDVQPELSADDALVLTLRLENVSRDVVFYPTDRAFNPRWEEGMPKPYTFLEVGERRFYGGPFRYEKRSNQPSKYRDPDPREHVRGQEGDDKPLLPGQRRTTLLCTNPEDAHVAEALRRYHGRLLWRVHLRRGLAAVRNKEVPATAVIGVEFADADVRRPG